LGGALITEEAPRVSSGAFLLVSTTAELHFVRGGDPIRCAREYTKQTRTGTPRLIPAADARLER
jgi:hypothetical protein